MTTRSTRDEIAFTRDEIAFLEGVIQRTEKMAASMLAEYGNGVRPSFVSADLADYGERVSRYKAEIAALKATSITKHMKMAIEDVPTLGPITAAAVHNVSLTELYEIINLTKGTAE